MIMPDAGTMIGMAIGFFGIGVATYLGAEAWIKVKRFQREAEHRKLSHAESEAEARLARIEQIVELTSIEIERVAEAQRFLTRTLTEKHPQLPDPHSNSGRVVTPH